MPYPHTRLYFGRIQYPKVSTSPWKWDNVILPWESLKNQGRKSLELSSEC